MASGAQKPLAVGNSIIAAFNFPNTPSFQSVPTKIRQRLYYTADIVRNVTPHIECGVRAFLNPTAHWRDVLIFLMQSFVASRLAHSGKACFVCVLTQGTHRQLFNAPTLKLMKNGNCNATPYTRGVQ
jgi:hypothetical protein